MADSSAKVDDRVIARLFAKLLVAYGTLWSDRFKESPPEALRADWLQVLEGLSLEQVAHGVRCLPPVYPPGAREFREICLQARVEQPVLITEGLEQNRKRVADEFRRLPEIQRAHRRNDGDKAWLRDLRQRAAEGHPLSPAQHRALRLADEQPGGVLPVDHDPVEHRRLQAEAKRKAEEAAQRLGIDLDELPPTFAANFARWKSSDVGRQPEKRKTRRGSR